MGDNEYMDMVLEMVNNSPFYQHIGMEVIGYGPGTSKLRIKKLDDMKNLYGTIHGGAIASLVDSACGVALGTMLDQGETVVTVDLRVNYLEPVSSGELMGEGKVVHKGRRIAVEEADISDSKGKLVAKGIATHMIIKRAQ